MGEELKKDMVEGVEEAASTEEVAGVQSEQKQEPEKKYTDADVDRIIAKKIAAERQRMLKAFNAEQQESEIEKRERNVLIRELKADAKDALIADGLPSSLANLLSYESKEDFDKSYKEITEIFVAAVQQGIKDRLRNPVPTRGYVSSGDAALKNAFAPKAR